MSAIQAITSTPLEKTNFVLVKLPAGFMVSHQGSMQHSPAEYKQSIAFLQGVYSQDPHFGIAFDGQVPESTIDHYIGGHPGHLIDGFYAMEKPAGCQWMSRSRIKSLCNHLGSVLVELEPAP